MTINLQKYYLEKSNGSRVLQGNISTYNLLTMLRPGKSIHSLR